MLKDDSNTILLLLRNFVQMINLQDKSLVLFDGVCNLCTSSIQFIIKRDKKNHFLFSSLQSDAGQQILLQNNRENLDF